MNTSLQKQRNQERKDFRVIVLGFIVIAVTGIFLFLMLASPILAMGVMSTANKQISSYTRKTVDVAASVAMKSVNITGSIIRGTTERTMQLVSLAADATMDAIQLIADVIMHIVDVVPPIAGMVVRNIDELLKMVVLCNSTIMGYMAELLDTGIGGVMDIVGQGFELIGNIGEFAGYLVANGFIPATQVLIGINEIVTKAVETLTDSYLPRLMSAMQFLAQTSNGQIIGDIRMTIISVVVSLFVKVFKKAVGFVTGGDIIGTIISSVTGVLKSINLNVLGKFDFCSVLLSIIEPALNLLNVIPGLSTINKCVPDFIRLGLWWSTQGSFCSSRNPITGFTDCLLGEIGNITIIPAFKLELSIRSLAGQIPGLSNPALSPIFNLFEKLLDGLPKFAFGWTNISLNTILSNLQGVLVFLFTDLKTILKKEAGGSLISFSPSPGTLLLPQVLLFVIIKVATQFMAKIVDMVYGENGFLKQALKIIDKWLGCVGFTIKIPFITTTKKFPFFKRRDIEFSVKFCISDIFGPILTLLNKIFSIAFSVLNTLFDVGDVILSFLGIAVPNIDASMIEAAVGRALSQLSNNLDLPFYFNT
jgi:hypothetical protein